MPDIAFMSDIHANFPALKATLDKLDNIGVEAIFHLGDCVGYYSQPDEVLDELRGRKIKGVMGNHDYMLIGKILNDSLSEEMRKEFENYYKHIRPCASDVLLWSVERIREKNLDYLLNCPCSRNITFSGINFLLVHGSPDYYGNEMASYSHKHVVLNADPPYPVMMEEKKLDVVLVGHTHKYYKLSFDSGRKFVINAGSVGQPRDGIPFPCCVVVQIDSGEITDIHPIRVKYNLSDTQLAAWESLLPWSVVQRLTRGK